jgi:hypothetical protein
VDGGSGGCRPTVLLVPVVVVVVVMVDEGCGFMNFVTSHNSVGTVCMVRPIPYTNCGPRGPVIYIAAHDMRGNRTVLDVVVDDDVVAVVELGDEDATI